MLHIREFCSFTESNDFYRVVAVFSLTSMKGSTIVTIRDTTVNQLIRKFGREELEKNLQEYDISGTIEALTNSEGKYILKYRTLESFRNALASRKSRFSKRISAEAQSQGEYSLTPSSPSYLHYESLLVGRRLITPLQWPLKILSSQEEANKVLVCQFFKDRYLVSYVSDEMASFCQFEVT